MKPKVTLLTSCSANGLADAAGPITRWSLEYVEVYAFMQPDLALFWPESCLRPGRPRNALYEMAAAQHTAGEVQRVGDIIHARIHPAKVAAFATFLPEIGASANTRRVNEVAQDALRFLIDLARYLKREKAHPVETIEIVGGSSTEGIWLGHVRGGVETYVLNRKDPNSALDRLWENILPVAREAAQGSPVKLGLELEPGPLFTVGNKEFLLKFCEKIETSEPEIQRVLGLNLDIPHWCFLAGISRHWVQQHPIILKNITHAHISDHMAGHFCDAEPLLFHGRAEFASWLRLLSDLGRQTLGKYSGFLTCELECCNDPERIHRALSCVKELINQEPS